MIYFIQLAEGQEYMWWLTWVCGSVSALNCPLGRHFWGGNPLDLAISLAIWYTEDRETPAISATSWYLWDWSRFTMAWHRSAEIHLPQAITQVKLQLTTTTPLIHFKHRPRVINKVSLVDLWTTGAWHCSGNWFFLRCAQSTFVPSLKDHPILPHFKNIYHVVIYLWGWYKGKDFEGKCDQQPSQLLWKLL